VHNDGNDTNAGVSAKMQGLLLIFFIFLNCSFSFQTQGSVFSNQGSMIQEKSKEWETRFRRLEYFDIRDLLNFLFIFLGILKHIFNIVKIGIFSNISSRFIFLI